ncbi:MAG: VWA domain-containing protein [bacterium]|nr:VWA domain-containing protein [bacterium]
MVFVRPELLWLLLLIVPLAALHLGRRVNLRPALAWTVAVLRALAFASLVFALARPLVDRSNATHTLVAVADVSASMSADDLARTRAGLADLATQRQPQEVMKLIAFDQQVQQVEFDLDSSEPDALSAVRHGEVERPGSALAAALELAGALVPQDGAGRIVLFSDGRETTGDALAVATRMAQRGIGIAPQPLGAAMADDVVLRALSMPPSAAVGATVEVEAEIESASETAAVLRIRCADRDDEITESVSLHTGKQTIICRCPLRREGVLRCTADVTCSTDVRPDNNHLETAVLVEPPKVVRVVESCAAHPATAALGALLGDAAIVTAMSPRSLAQPGALDAIDLLVIADTPAELIDAETQRRIKAAVTDGLALLATGGRRSFGPGGYAGSPLADVLPVRFAQETERRDPSATLVVIIDTSGSMGGPRVNLAKEIARLAIARLKPHDKVGIVEFYGSKHWAAPIQAASNAIDLQRALNRLSAGGGTVILPAIEEAYYALRNVRTRTRHVLVLTDGGVEPGAFEPLIRKMADHGITLSAVMVGPGGHSAFLARLAQWGRGRFYAAPDRFNLPEIIVKQPESSMLTPFVERPTTLVAQRTATMIEGIDLTTAPEIHGYVETEAQPSADVLLESSLGHPLLTRWRYGLGSVAAWTSQLGGEWTLKLAQWPPYARMTSNLVRSLCSPSDDQALRIQPHLHPGAVEVRIDSRLAGTETSCAPVVLTLTGQTSAPQTCVLDPVAPNLWNARIADLAPGTYHLQARTTDGSLAGAAALTIPPVREVATLEPNQALLDEIDALRELAATRAAELTEVNPTQPREVWPILVGAALALFLLNILMRRWPERSASRRTAPVAMLGILVLGSVVPRAAVAQTAARAPDSRPAAVLAQDTVGALEAVLDIPDRAVGSHRFDEVCRSVLERTGSLDNLVAILRSRSLSDTRANWMLAKAARDNGNLELAYTALLQATAAAPGDSELLGEQARIEELLGHDLQAVATIDRALEHETDSTRRAALEVRKALILYSASGPAAGGRVVRAAIDVRPDDAAWTSFCAHLAALNNDYTTAVSLLLPAGEGKGRFHAHLFRGLFLMKLDRALDAETEFEKAYRQGPLTRDRRFALERVVAAARQSGRLAELADRWLSDPDLMPEKASALLAVLRELGRPEEALAFLHNPVQTPELSRAIETTEFQHEIIAIAVEAGQATQAEAAYRALLERDPARLEWRSGLARLLLFEDRRAEALELFRAGTAASEKTPALLALAAAARDLALDEAALEATRKAGTLGPSARVRAILFEADLAHLRGDADQALRLLKQAGASVGEDPKRLLPVAEAFERYGDKSESLRLFKRLYDRNRGEDVVLRLAWLLEENQHFDEAYELWNEMWRTTRVPARRRQAQERVLDLASRTGRLADLAIELEERLDAGQGGDHDLDLLVSIYTTANDAVSAAEILQEFAKRSGDRVQMLQHLARVYLSCEQFGRCNAVLRRLIGMDPENAADYVQQIAIVALERGRQHEVKAALVQLRSVSPDGEAVDEFSAGVLDLIGLHTAAAESYARVLVRHPNRIEAFLLWGNAMKAAGRTDQALARFQILLEEAVEDDLFTVAVDGLLNLDANPVMLRSALRRVFARIAAKPDKTYLYNLAVDLLDALGRIAEKEAVLEQAVVVAGERRVQLLRELMEGAASERRHARLIQFGRSLMALGELVPPQVYLDLGQAMIKEEQYAAAERVFERAGIGADFSAIQQRVATCYDEAGLPQSAEHTIRRLLITQPDDIPLLIRAGGLSEQMGHFAPAFEQYERAANLMLQRLPAAVRRHEVETSKSSRSPVAPRRRSRAKNLDEMDQFFESANNGLLNAARTPALRTRLVEELPARIEAELDTLRRERSLMPALARNPRLHRLASFARRVAFALHTPEIALQIDRLLMEHYPRDDDLRASAVRARVDWGLYTRAAALAGDVTLSADPPEALVVYAYLGDRQRLEAALTGEGLPERLARRLLPALIITGRDEDARQVLRAVQVGDPTDTAETATVMIAGASALHDRESTNLWATRWLGACRRLPTGKSAADEAARCLRLVWHELAPPEQAELLRRVDSLANAFAGAERIPLDLLRLEISQATAVEFGDRDRLAEEVARDASLSLDSLVTVLQAVPDAQRPRLVHAAVAARKPAQARAFLMGLTGALRAPADARLCDTVAGSFKAAPRVRLRPDRVYSLVSTGDWNRNPQQPELARRLGEIMLSEMPNETAVLTAVAMARENAGLHEDAVLLAGEAIDTLLGAKEPDFQQARMWTDLVALMRPAELEELLDDVTDQQEIEGATATSHYARGVLLEAADDSAAALRAFLAAFHMSPTNRTFSRRIISRLKNAGRLAELTRELSAHLTKSSIMESYEWRTLVLAYCDLFAPAAAARAAQRLEGPLRASQVMYAARMMGHDDDVRSTFRRFLINNRNQGRFYNPYWPDATSSGGMIAFVNAKPRHQRKTMFAAVADLPFAEADLEALLTAAPPERRDVPGMISGLAAATRTGARARLIDALGSAEQRKSLTTKDYRLILALGKHAADVIPDELADRLHDFIVHLDSTDRSGVELLTASARFWQQRGSPEPAQRILLWLVANDLRHGRSAGRQDERFRHLDDYLELLPDEQRDAERGYWLGRFAPTPLDGPVDSLDAAVLNRWTAEHDLGPLRQQVESLQGMLDRDTSGGSFRVLHTALAQGYAALDQYARFAAAVDKVFAAAWGERGRSSTPPTHQMLPDRAALAEPARYVEHIASTVTARRNDGTLTAVQATQALCLLGHWCVTNGRAETARVLLQSAEQVAGEIGQHWLWVADLAREADVEAKAIDLERRLLDASVLPIPRVPSLLAALEEREGQAVADALALGVAEYSDLPEVLERAARAARAVDDIAGESAYLRRLRPARRPIDGPSDD